MLHADVGRCSRTPSEPPSTSVVGLAPEGTEVVKVQLVIDEPEWRARFGDDRDRPPLDGFYVGRYRQAQATPADHRVDVTNSTAPEVAAEVARVTGLD